ncbi:MAG: hypothetical protein ACI8Z7_000679 [Candidatus Nanohaloarchaea archaeon]
MKGQYLAVESVITVGMGITLAFGTIAVFDTYQETVEETTVEKQVEETHYRVKTAFYNLRGANSGTVDIDLPEELGGTSYSLAADDQIVISTPEEQYTSSLGNLDEYSIQGSVQGGTVTLYKSGDQYTLRSN